MKKVLGIVFSNMHEHTVSELTANRCMGSIPVGGRYRLIDFALSSMVNSGMEKVGVITKSNYQSLMDHLGNGREWDLSRKNGGLVILPPFGSGESGMYRGRVEAFAGIMRYIKSTGCQYVLSADCDTMANIDYRRFRDAHIESGADITVMYKKMSILEGGGKDQCTFVTDDDGFVREMFINPEAPGAQNVYLNIMIADRELLEHAVSAAYSRSQFSFEKDVLQAGVGSYKIHAYEFDGYVARFNSMRSYYQANMAFLQPEVREALFPMGRPIYTKVRDEAPVRYGLKNKVSNSMLADGCLIEGEVENSILFRGVTVSKGAKVKNCVLMQGTQVGEGSNLDYVITDKDVTVKDNRMIMGFETYPVYIAKGSAV